MRIKRKTRSGMEYSSALSDLAFLLIIYFIVIAGFNVNIGFLLNLPKKDSVLLVPRDELLRFSLDETGSLFFMEEALGYDEAAGKISAAIAQRPNTAVILNIDGKAPWQKVVSFVDLAQKEKVDSFSFSLLQKEQP
jgi:biopolymer transport protein ExbD